MIANGHQQVHALLQDLKDQSHIDLINSPEYVETKVEIPANLEALVEAVISAAKKHKKVERVLNIGDTLARNNPHFAEVWKAEFSMEEKNKPEIEVTHDSSIPDLGYDLSYVDTSSSLCARLLEEYRGFSQELSPESYKTFHDAGFWYTASIIAQRRIAIELASKLYTNLYLSLCAKSTIWRKSTALKPVEQILDDLSLRHLLHKGEETPEYFVQQASGGIVPERYDIYDEFKQQLVRQKLASAGLGGLFVDELGQYLLGTRNMMGNMALWRRIILEWEDCPRSWTKGTKTGGEEIVERPYLTIFGCFVPGNFKDKQMESVLSEGTIARFLVMAPSEQDVGEVHTIGRKRILTPPSLLKAFSEWNQRLVPPSAEVEIEYNKANRATYTLNITQPIKETRMEVSEDAWLAWDNHRRAVRNCIRSKDLSDTIGAFYDRGSTAFLKIAGIAASIDATKQIGMQHMAIALQLIESARRGSHNFLSQIGCSSGAAIPRAGKSLRTKIMSQLQERPGMTPRQLGLNVNAKAEDVKIELNLMEEEGMVTSSQAQNSKRYTLA